jgi:hypothetical protein
MSNLPQQTTVKKFIAEGIKAHAAFKGQWKAAKNAAITAGALFYQARQLYKDGDFGDYLEATLGEEDISRRTIERYIEFTEDILTWAVEANPKLKGDFARAMDVGRKMVMQSPKSFTALLRDGLDELPALGAYNPASYRRRRVGNQIEFSFDDFSKTIQTWTANVDNLKLPDDPAVIDKTIDELEQVLSKLKAQRGPVLNTEDVAKTLSGDETPDSNPTPLPPNPAPQYIAYLCADAPEKMLYMPFTLVAWLQVANGKDTLWFGGFSGFDPSSPIDEDALLEAAWMVKDNNEGHTLKTI